MIAKTFGTCVFAVASTLTLGCESKPPIGQPKAEDGYAKAENRRMDELVFEFDHIRDEPGLRVAVNNAMIQLATLESVNTAEVTKTLPYKVIGTLFMTLKDGTKRRIVVYSTWKHFGEKGATYKADLSELRDYLKRALSRVGEWAFSKNTD